MENARLGVALARFIYGASPNRALAKIWTFEIPRIFTAFQGSSSIKTISYIFLNSRVVLQFQTMLVSKMLTIQYTTCCDQKDDGTRKVLLNWHDSIEHVSSDAGRRSSLLVLHVVSIPLQSHFLAKSQEGCAGARFARGTLEQRSSKLQRSLIGGIVVQP